MPPASLQSTVSTRSRSVFDYAIRAIAVLFPFHRAAWQIAADPLRRLLNEPTEDEKNALTKRWKDSMQQELSMIGVTGALVGSVVAASIAWSNAATQAGWAIVALWYIALVIALMAVSSATLQTVTLNRLISRPDGLSDIRVMLSGKPPTAAAQSVQPKRLQIYIWQIPLKLLNSSIYLFLVGLLALLWEAAALRGKELGYRDMKIAAAVTVGLSVAVLHYVLAAICIYDGIRLAQLHPK